jgi:hypothetical protein
MVATHWDARWVDLRVTRVCEGSTLLERPKRGCDVASFGVCRKIEDIAVTARGQDDGIRRMRSDFAGCQISSHNAPGLTINHDDVQHLCHWKHLAAAQPDLALQRLIRPDEQLLAGLPSRVEGSRNLGATERAVRQQSSVLSCEGNTLGHTLVDNVDADLCQAIDVGLASAEIAAFDRVVEQAVDAISVVRIVFRGIDSALSCNAVRAPGRILETETLDVVAKLGERSCRGTSGQSRTDDDDVELPLVGRVDQLHLQPITLPLLL